MALCHLPSALQVKAACLVWVQAAAARLEREARTGDRSGFRRSRNTIFGRVLYLLAIQKPGDRFAFAVCRPNTGASYFDFEARPTNPTCPPPPVTGLE